MPRSDYARIIGEVFRAGKFDAMLIRDTETGYELISQYPDLAKNTSVYITGVTSLDSEPSPETISQIRMITSSGAKLVSQTPSMVKQIIKLDLGIEPADIFVLPPHVPDAEGDFEEIYHFSEHPSRLAYTGKFFKAWNADKILAAFKAVKASTAPSLTLEVAGDQFRNDPDDPYFVRNVNYLLLSSPGLKWHGRVPRSISRQIIGRSHIGVSWRASELDTSSELSTKILEYGAMGRPSILNRNPLHEELLGEDYPLFTNTMTEFKALLTNLGTMSAEVEKAARACYELSQSHWYSTILPKLMEHLGNTSAPKVTGEIVLPYQGASIDQVPGEMLHVKANAIIDGMWLRITPDSDSSSTVAQLLTVTSFFAARSEKELLHNRQRRMTFYAAKDRASIGGVANPTPQPEEATPQGPDHSTTSILQRLNHLEQRNRNLESENIRLRKNVDLIKTYVNKVETKPWGKPALKFARRLRDRML